MDLRYLLMPCANVPYDHMLASYLLHFNHFFYALVALLHRTIISNTPEMKNGKPKSRIERLQPQRADMQPALSSPSEGYGPPTS